jgi:uncharacterized protein YbaR (Trm112 family)
MSRSLALTDIVRCPQDKTRLEPRPAGLACAGCGRVYRVEDRIGHLLDEAALDASARAQMAVYDERFRAMSPVAHERLFASQLVYRTALLDQALGILGRQPHDGEVWLYIGGGEGTQCMALGERGGFHVSFDVSLGQLRTGTWLLRHLAPTYFPRLRADRVAFVWGDGERPLPFVDACAQVAYGIGVLNHFPPGAWGHHVAELARAVAPGGLVFQVVPNPASAFFRRPVMLAQFATPGAMQYWTQFIDPTGIERAFRDAGLRDVRTEALWRLDHDQVPGRYWKVDFLLASAFARLNPRWRVHPGITLQRLLLRAAERRRRWARRVTFDPLKHLLVVGAK